MGRLTLIKQRRLIAAFLVGLLLFYSPLITLFDRPAEWLGIPVLYLYLFGGWAGLIGAMAWIVRGDEE
jgi:hypothetical protein